MENKKPIAIGKSFIYVGTFWKYVLGIREEDEMYIVSDGK